MTKESIRVIVEANVVGYNDGMASRSRNCKLLLYVQNKIYEFAGSSTDGVWTRPVAVTRDGESNTPPVGETAMARALREAAEKK